MSDRAGQVGGLILAAGRSRRLGRPKAEIPVHGRPALLHLVDTYRGVGLHPVVVVVSDAGRALAERIDPPVVVVAGDPNRPMVDSVARGLAALETCAGALIQPVDAPFTRAEALQALLASPAGRAAVLRHRGRPGHPVYLPRARFAEVAARPEGGLRTVLTTDVETIEWNTPEILADLDTPEDLARWGLG